jgi:hypothetical protein
MNEIVTVQQDEPRSYGLVPATMAEAMQLADMMASAKLVPAALQKSPADCLMVIQQAVRWQMDPFAVAQECSVIQGKLMHSGKLVAAVINVRGNLANRLSFAYAGDGDNRTITVSGRVQGEAEARTVSVKLKDAKTANKMWQVQPDQQLMYHGSRVWARRHAPELMLGVYSPEEFDDIPASAKRPPPPSANVMLPPHDPQTGEITNPPSGQESTRTADAGSPDLPRDGGSADDFGITDELMKYDRLLTKAAEQGTKPLLEAAKKVPEEHRGTLAAAWKNRYWPRAAEVDGAEYSSKRN